MAGRRENTAVVVPVSSLPGGLAGPFSYPKAGSCPLTLSVSKGVSGPLEDAPLIWFDKLTMSGVYPELR